MIRFPIWKISLFLNYSRGFPPIPLYQQLLLPLYWHICMFELVADSSESYFMYGIHKNSIVESIVKVLSTSTQFAYFVPWYDLWSKYFNIPVCCGNKCMHGDFARSNPTNSIDGWWITSFGRKGYISKLTMALLLPSFQTTRPVYLPSSFDGKHLWWFKLWTHKDKLVSASVCLVGNVPDMSSGWGHVLKS